MRPRVIIYAVLALLAGTGRGTAQTDTTSQDALATREAIYDHPRSPGTEATSPSGRVVTLSQLVRYQEGKLTIFVQNGKLSSILAALKDQMGTYVDAPVALDTTPVSANIGPGDPATVLSSLLYGSDWDYILLGSAGGNEVSKIILKRRSLSPTLPPRTLVASAVAQVPTAGDHNPPSDVQENGDVKSDDVATTEAPKDGDDGGAKDNATKSEKEEVAANDENTKGDGGTQAQKDESAGSEVELAEKDAALKDQPGGEQSASDRLANLPANINPAIASLYPALFSPAGTDQASSSKPITVQNQTVTVSSSQIPRAAPRPATPVVPPITTANGVPILPSNIPPQIWNLYPPNLMQLIKNNSTPPVIVPVVTPVQPYYPIFPAPSP